MAGTCVAEKAESPVYREIGMIEDRLTESEKVSQLLSERLSSVLSDAQPQGETADKPKSASQLEGRLNAIRNRMETNLLFLQDVVNRLTV